MMVAVNGLMDLANEGSPSTTTANGEHGPLQGQIFPGPRATMHARQDYSPAFAGACRAHVACSFARLHKGPLRR